MTRRAWLPGAVALIAVAVIGALAANRPPTIPASAASLAIERTSTTAGHGQSCLERQQLGSGWADICWSVNGAEDIDGSATQDYYELKVYGSFERLKWLVVRADLVGVPNAGGYTIWPEFPIEGDCHQVHADRGPISGSPAMEVVCGRVAGVLEEATWRQTLTWMCEQCLLVDDTTRSLVMYGQISVDQGTVPAWDLFLDGAS